MKEDFSELVEFIDGKFTEVNRNLGELKTQVFDLDVKIKDLQENKADKGDINNLLNSVDAYATKADKYFQEFLMLAQKVDRHEKWLLQIAQKLGINLDY